MLSGKQFVDIVKDNMPDFNSSSVKSVKNIVTGMLEDLENNEDNRDQYAIVFGTMAVLSAYEQHTSDKADKSFFANTIRYEWHTYPLTFKNLCQFCKVPLPQTDDEFKYLIKQIGTGILNNSLPWAEDCFMLFQDINKALDCSIWLNNHRLKLGVTEYTLISAQEVRLKLPPLIEHEKKFNIQIDLYTTRIDLKCCGLYKKHVNAHEPFENLSSKEAVQAALSEIQMKADSAESYSLVLKNGISSSYNSFQVLKADLISKDFLPQLSSRLGQK